MAICPSRSENHVIFGKLCHIGKIGIPIPAEICYGDAGIAVWRFEIFENVSVLGLEVGQLGHDLAKKK